MNIIIAGSRWIGEQDDEESRDWAEVHAERSMVWEKILLGMEVLGAKDNPDTIGIVGKAKGVDSIGERWLDKNGIDKKPMPADWKTHGRAAGILRNLEMAREAGPNGGLILIWDGESKGSKHMLETARKTGMKIFEWVYRKDGSQRLTVSR